MEWRYKQKHAPKGRRSQYCLKSDQAADWAISFFTFSVLSERSLAFARNASRPLRWSTVRRAETAARNLKGRDCWQGFLRPPQSTDDRREPRRCAPPVA